jgi:hypothetical protein
MIALEQDLRRKAERLPQRWDISVPCALAGLPCKHVAGPIGIRKLASERF